MQQRFPHLKTCVINLCVYPHISTRSLHSALGETGVLAAATVAVNLRRALNTGDAFPSLKKCLIVSSDFEVADDDGDGVFRDGWEECPGLSYGEISEFVVHNVLEESTRIMPIHSKYCYDGINDLERMRDRAIFFWRRANDKIVEVTVSAAEPLMEGMWDNLHECLPPAPKQVVTYGYLGVEGASDGGKYSRYHAELYSGLLDRTSIREKRIEDGTAAWRYNTW